MERKGMEEIVFIPANSKFKSIIVSDVNMNSVKNPEILSAKQSTSSDKKEWLALDKKKSWTSRRKCVKQLFRTKYQVKRQPDPENQDPE